MKPVEEKAEEQEIASEETESKVEQIDLVNELVEKIAWVFRGGIGLKRGSPKFKQVLKILREVPFPLPITPFVTSTGEAPIYFQWELRVPIESEVKDFCQLIMDEKWLELYIHETDQNERIWGKPVFDEDLFYEKNPNITKPVEDDSKGRSLKSNDTQVSRESFDQKAFNWTIYEFRKDRIGIQLYFEDKTAITEGVMDKLQFMYQEPAEFLIRE